MKFVIDKSKMNANKYKSGKRSKTTGVVLHHTAGNNPGDWKILSGQSERQVSIHFWIPDYADSDGHKYITDKGEYIIYQLLPIDQIGWHTGKAITGWGNSYTVGIEIGNLGNGVDKFEKAQVEAVKVCLAEIENELRLELPLKTHAEIALPKGRKIDPHYTFPSQAMKDFIVSHKVGQTADNVVINPTPTPQPKPKPISNVIEKGSKGELVKKAQTLLNKHGYNLVVDGDFGDKTDAAVKSFQLSKNLVVDGIVGKNTWAALEAAPVALKPILTRVLKIDKSGADVKVLQQLLNNHGYGLKVDGRFGKLTHRAVMDYQSKNKLSVDGKVEKNTATKLGFIWKG